MQPSESSSNNDISLSTKQRGQQTVSGKDRKRSGSVITNRAGVASPFRVSEWGNANSTTSTPALKKVKTSHRHLPTMAKTTGMMNRPGVIDLTRPAKFPTHEGPRRLVIKNLRTTSPNNLEQYYKKTWAELDNALTANFNRQQPATPLEVLCRGVEAVCRHGEGEKLAKHVRTRSKTYLETELLPQIEKEASSGSVDALRAVHKFWSLWNEQSVRLPPTVSRNHS